MNNSQTPEIRLQGPVKHPTPLNILYVTLPFYFNLKANNADRKTLEARRHELMVSLTNHTFEAVKQAALDVFSNKKLRGVADEVEFLAEVEKWEPHHYNAVRLSSH